MHEDARAERAILSSAEAYRLVEEARSQRERAEHAEAEAERLTAKLDAILVRCIDLVPGLPGLDADPRVWRCRICTTRGEYPGFEHSGTCPVRSLHNPVPKERPKESPAKPCSPYTFQSTCGVCGVVIGGDGDVCNRCATR